MGFLLTAVPPHRDPAAEDEVAGHVEDEHEQEPPGLHLEIEVRLGLDVDPYEVEADHEGQQQDPGNALEDHEEEHGGHTTTGLLA
jgi:hypothetical protein